MPRIIMVSNLLEFFQIYDYVVIFSELLALLPASPIHLLPSSTVDFGGFDSRKVTKLYEEACKQGQNS